ncbi:hypothetical protein BZG12_02955 [Salinivibrio kushneri]|nr:hypothetical protein BZG12_02955 [Salinivibrio kushneri]
MVKQPVQALPQPSLRFFCTKVGTYAHFWQSHLVPLLFLEDFSSMPTRRLLVGFFMHLLPSFDFSCRDYANSFGLAVQCARI